MRLKLKLALKITNVITSIMSITIVVDKFLSQILLMQLHSSSNFNYTSNRICQLQLHK